MYIVVKENSNKPLLSNGQMYFNTKEEAEIERIYLQPDYDEILKIEKIF